MLNFLYNWQLKFRKRKMLHEVQRDIEFIKTYRAHVLAYDEDQLRADLNIAKGKKDPDYKLIEELSVKIGELTATKRELFNLERTASELPLYIGML